MTTVTVAAVQAAYVLMDREATLAKVEKLLADPEVQAADLVVFPEAFVPGTPIWIDGPPIWDGDEEWFAMLADQAVVVPSNTTERLAAAARDAGAYLVIGIDEREPTGSTIYNTLLYFAPDGSLLGKHRKLMPTGSERTVWGMGDGSTLDTYPTPFGRIGGLICWETTCRWPGSTCTHRALTCGWRRRWREVTAGSRPCGTSPGRAAAT
jgi:nitrilase